MYSGICGQRVYASAQSDQDIRCPQIGLLVTTECFNGEKMRG